MHREMNRRTWMKATGLAAGALASGRSGPADAPAPGAGEIGPHPNLSDACHLRRGHDHGAETVEIARADRLQVKAVVRCNQIERLRAVALR